MDSARLRLEAWLTVLVWIGLALVSWLWLNYHVELHRRTFAIAATLATLTAFHGATSGFVDVLRESRAPLQGRYLAEVALVWFFLIAFLPDSTFGVEHGLNLPTLGLYSAHLAGYWCHARLVQVRWGSSREKGET